ncbi:hypothetical protein T484DRAFT_1797070 [Baffinella frigidus]|nr:hypothetical protein T484DRAFT_1797070 [Cryptophyta sp. CCMP2293]
MATDVGRGGRITAPSGGDGGRITAPSGSFPSAFCIGGASPALWVERGGAGMARSTAQK